MSGPWWQLSPDRAAHYVVWESSDEHESVDEALQALEVELAEWLE